MTSTNCFFWRTNQGADSDGFLISTRTHTFSRLPIVGEMVSIVDGDEEMPGEYEVAFVHHIADAQTSSGDAEAELYLIRRYFTDAIKPVWEAAAAAAADAEARKRK